MHGLAFGEVDADDLPLDLGAHDVGVVGNHRADTAEIDRHVMLGDHPGDDRHRGRRSGRGSGLLQWVSMYVKYRRPPAAITAVSKAAEMMVFFFMVALAHS